MKKVNEKISKYSRDFFSAVQTVLLNEKKNNEEEKKETEEVLERIQAEMASYELKISSHFVVFFEKSVLRGTVSYFQLLMTNDRAEFFETNFENLFKYIDENCQKFKKKNIKSLEYQIGSLFQLNNDQTAFIQQSIRESVMQELKREKTVACIYFDIKYDIFFNFRYFEGFYGIASGYYKFSVKFEKICAEISKKVSENTSDDEIANLKTKHYFKFNELLIKNFDSLYRRKIEKFIKYLSANAFCKNFSLAPQNISYDTLNSIIEFPLKINYQHKPKGKNKENEIKDFTDHQIKITEKSMKMFECLCYYDNEFLWMIKNLFGKEFLIYKTLFDIYEVVIKKSSERNYYWTQVIDRQISIVESYVFTNQFLKYLDLFSSIIDIDKIKIKAFIESLKEVHLNVLRVKKNELNELKMNHKIVHLKKTVSILSFTL